MRARACRTGVHLGLARAPRARASIWSRVSRARLSVLAHLARACVKCSRACARTISTGNVSYVLKNDKVYLYTTYYHTYLYILYIPPIYLVYTVPKPYGFPDSGFRSAKASIFLQSVNVLRNINYAWGPWRSRDNTYLYIYLYMIYKIEYLIVYIFIHVLLCIRFIKLIN